MDTQAQIIHITFTLFVLKHKFEEHIWPSEALCLKICSLCSLLWHFWLIIKGRSAVAGKTHVVKNPVVTASTDCSEKALIKSQKSNWKLPQCRSGFDETWLSVTHVGGQHVGLFFSGHPDNAVQLPLWETHFVIITFTSCLRPVEADHSWTGSAAVCATFPYITYMYQLLCVVQLYLKQLDTYLLLIWGWNVHLIESPLSGVPLWAASHHLLSASQRAHSAPGPCFPKPPHLLITTQPRLVWLWFELQELQSCLAHEGNHSVAVPSEVFFVKMEMHQMGQVVMKKKTRVLKASGGQCQWKETFHFLLAALDDSCSLLVKLYSRSSIRRKKCLGQVSGLISTHRHVQPDAKSRGMTALLMFLAGSAGVWQPRLRGGGTVEGHNGSPRESGGCVAQVEPCLKLSAQPPPYWRAAGPAVPSWVNSRPLAIWADSDGPPPGLLNGVGPGWHFRLSVVNEGLEQNVGAGKRFLSFLCG